MIRPKKLLLKRDAEATAKQNFANGRSWVHLDGRHLLYGADKVLVRYRIFVRDGFKCVFCGKPVVWDPGQWNSGEWHHLRHKERVKDDRPQAGVCACKSCHSQHHGRVTRFGK
jgi:hypothetical protein